MDTVHSSAVSADASIATVANPSTSTPNQTAVSVDPPAYDRAYEKRAAELGAIAANDLLQVNVDVRAAIATVLGALPKLQALRPEIAKLSHFDVAMFDGIEDYAGALGHAHSQYMSARPQVAELQALYDQAALVRDTLRSDVSALAHRGIVDGGRLEQFKGLNGYKNVAFDVIGIADLLLSYWPSIENKTALTLTELNQAKAVAERLMKAFGAREQSGPVVADAALARQRAFTQFAHAYDQARRAVAFLHWNEGDVDTIAPSIYAGRGTGRTKSDTTAPAAGTAPVVPGTTPVTSVPAPGASVPVTSVTSPASGTSVAVGVAPAANGGHAAGNGNAAAAAPVATENLPPGFGGGPFFGRG